MSKMIERIKQGNRIEAIKELFNTEFFCDYSSKEKQKILELMKDVET